MIEKEKVIFVYLGKSIPRYANASLQLAAQTSGLDVVLVGNEILGNQITSKNVTFVKVEDFYSPKEFQEVKNFVKYPHDFRDNFWLKTLERFFVLEQLMSHLNYEHFFHAELDQLLFNCNVLIEKLEYSGLSGLFVPFHNDVKAVASILYCNNKLALSSLINFAKSGISFENEMELVALWTHQEPELAHALPTLATELKNECFSKQFPNKVLRAVQIGGIADAAQLGQWVAGIDPKNIPISKAPLTRYFEVDSPFLLTKTNLESLAFELDSDGNFLVSSKKYNFSYQLYNLHIHSKIHKWFLRFNSPKKRILFLSNNSKSYLVLDSKYDQIKYFFDGVINSFKRNPKDFIFRLFKLIFSKKAK